MEKIVWLLSMRQRHYILSDSPIMNVFDPCLFCFFENKMGVWCNGKRMRIN